jgi:hypothetical protein
MLPRRGLEQRGSSVEPGRAAEPVATIAGPSTGPLWCLMRPHGVREAVHAACCSLAALLPRPTLPMGPGRSTGFRQRGAAWARVTQWIGRNLLCMLLGPHSPAMLLALSATELLGSAGGALLILRVQGAQGVTWVTRFCPDRM